MLQLYRGMTRANHQYILLDMHSSSRKQEHDCPLCVKFANDCLHEVSSSQAPQAFSGGGIYHVTVRVSLEP